MSIIEFDDKNNSETNNGFYNTLRDYANKAESDKLDKKSKRVAKEKEEDAKDPDKKFKK